MDINALASGIMLERVEVLTDGASALYGSDAVAGVVNMITRNDFEGLELEVSGMQVDRAGTNDVTFGALFGSQGENTSIVAGLEGTSRPRDTGPTPYRAPRTTPRRTSAVSGTTPWATNSSRRREIPTTTTYPFFPTCSRRP